MVVRDLDSGPWAQSIVERPWISSATNETLRKPLLLARRLASGRPLEGGGWEGPQRRSSGRLRSAFVLDAV